MAAGQLLVVTTRSRLRSPRYFPAMFLASRRIGRQLADTDGLVRAASLVAGPAEFWTVTVWRSRDAMQAFMGSGAHGEILWRVSRWLRSFWLLRWRPGPAETGSWDGLRLGAGDGPPAGGRSDGPADEVLAGIPQLRASIGPNGAPTYERAPTVRRARVRLGAVGAAVVRLRGPWYTHPLALGRLLLLRRRLRAEPDLLRSAVGAGGPDEALLLTVWRDAAAAARLLEHPAVHAAGRGRCDLWAAELRPESEFGHWDGLRLRSPRHRRVWSVP